MGISEGDSAKREREGPGPGGGERRGREGERERGRGMGETDAICATPMGISTAYRGNGSESDMMNISWFDGRQGWVNEMKASFEEKYVEYAAPRQNICAVRLR